MSNFVYKRSETVKNEYCFLNWYFVSVILKNYNWFIPVSTVTVEIICNRRRASLDAIRKNGWDGYFSQKRGMCLLEVWDKIKLMGVSYMELSYENVVWKCLNIHISIYTFFLCKQHLQATPDWNWQKIKQKLSNTLRLNFCYLKVIRSPHSRYHPKIIGDILKMYKKKEVRLFQRGYMINDYKNEITWNEK